MANYEYKPKFVPGPAPCRIKSYTLKRGRLTIGGTFFRTKQLGSHTPQIQCKWLTNDLDGSLQPIGTVNYTTDQLYVKSVELHIWGNDKSGVAYDNTYYALQEYDPSLIPPENIEIIGWTNAIPSLRSRVNSTDPLVSMPTTDIQANYDSINEEYISIFGPVLIVPGVSAPTSPAAIASIRTGPNKTLINISQTETENLDDGSLHEVNSLYEWTGFDWIPS